MLASVEKTLGYRSVGSYPGYYHALRCDLDRILKALCVETKLIGLMKAERYLDEEATIKKGVEALVRRQCVF